MVKYPKDYNPLIEYWEWAKANPKKVNKKIKAQLRKLVSDISDITTDVYYDNAKANHAIEFMENYCRNIKGKFAGKLVVLDLWEKAFVAAIFGICYKETGLRRTKRAVLFVAKKNGKSLLAAAIGLYMQVADGEGGPEVYTVATQKDQAKIIWDVAKRMIAKERELKKLYRSLVSELITDFNDGKFKALASDSDSLDGHDVHCVLMDEIHQWKRGYDLYDVLYRGMDNRQQPLALLTSTAGSIREDIFDMIYEEAENILNSYDRQDGFKDNESVFFIYELDSRKEWEDFENLIKANPGLGTIRNETSLKNEWNKTKNNPGMYLKSFLTKNCNIRETSQESWLSREDIVNINTFDLKELKPTYVLGGVDMSSTTDLTCVTFFFKVRAREEMFAYQMYFIPEDLIETKEITDKVPYRVWEERGLVVLLPGNKINQDAVWEWVYQFVTENELIVLWAGFDTWGADLLMKRFGEYFGKKCPESVIQGKKTLSNPMKALKAELQAKKINYNNNPILTWCLANTSVDIDRNGNIQPVKKISSLQRIDGTASLLNAYVTYLRHEDDYNNLI